MKIKVYDALKEKFADLVEKAGLGSEEVQVKATTLTPEEAIGNPEDKDYPLVIGRERLVQAEFRGCCGQAFTDMYGSFTGPLNEVVNMDLKNNYRRAVFIAALNAVTRHLGLVDKTIHCRDAEPRTCSQELVKYVAENYGHPKIAMIGLQPRMLESLAADFELRVTDMDAENIGTSKAGVVIQDPADAPENIEWCDIVMATGTTVTNDTIDQFITDKPAIFYGITVAGAAGLLGLNRWCHLGH